ncbi:hypothetical protein QQF64_018142 [Cirrhinus molitorella]|uniref:CBP80/20-dependent translation initiation factor n=1 Tax=Cirrhinus molitorella TaxID=172907 RepID=A0ABR3LNX4_9TELE
MLLIFGMAESLRRKWRFGGALTQNGGRRVWRPALVTGCPGRARDGVIERMEEEPDRRSRLPSLPPPTGLVAMESSSVASASSEAGSTRSQEIEELERFIDSYVLEYQVQGLLSDKNETDQEVDKTPSHISQWTEDCSDKIDGSWSSSRGRGSSKPDEWEHSSNGSTGSRPSSGSRPGSGSRSGSRGRNNQFRAPAKNGNRDCSFDVLGTDIWAANLDCHGGATWDMQPEKLDFSQFHRRPYRGTPKHLPHIDREGMIKGKFDDDDGIDLDNMEKFLPSLPVFPPLPNEAEIAHTKKLFRRRRNDRRRSDPPQDLLTVLLPAEGKRQVSRSVSQTGPAPESCLLTLVFPLTNFTYGNRPPEPLMGSDLLSGFKLTIF